MTKHSAFHLGSTRVVFITYELFQSLLFIIVFLLPGQIIIMATIWPHLTYFVASMHIPDSTSLSE